MVPSWHVDWLAHSAKIFSYQPIFWRMDLDQVGYLAEIFFFSDREFFGEDREYFPCTNQKFGEWGQVRGEEALHCHFKAKIDYKLVFSWFLPDMLTGWPILPKSTPINQ